MASQIYEILLGTVHPLILQKIGGKRSCCERGHSRGWMETLRGRRTRENGKITESHWQENIVSHTERPCVPLAQFFLRNIL